MSAYCQGLILCEQPLIVYSSHYQAAAAAVNTLPSVIGDREAIFLPLTGWTMERPGEIAAARQYARQSSRAAVIGHLEDSSHPNHDGLFSLKINSQAKGLRYKIAKP